MTSAEEYRKATAPWVRCAWCGTLRPPSALDGSVVCRDFDWCRRAAAERWAKLQAWPRDYQRLTSVSGLEVVGEFSVRPDDAGHPFPGITAPEAPRGPESSAPNQPPPGSRR